MRCWECGEVKECREVVFCCTGTLYLICQKCEEKINDSKEGDLEVRKQMAPDNDCGRPRSL